RSGRGQSSVILPGLFRFARFFGLDGLRLHHASRLVAPPSIEQRDEATITPEPEREWAPYRHVSPPRGSGLPAPSDRGSPCRPASHRARSRHTILFLSPRCGSRRNGRPPSAARPAPAAPA